MKRKIAEIRIPEGRRTIDPAKVLALAESIELIGLINPIAITGDDVLIAGWHRLEAHKYLGRDEIECVVLNCDELRSRLAEIDENLIRNDLDPIGIGEQAILRDGILDAMRLRAKSGDNRFTDRGADSAPLQTTADIANEIGISKRVLQENKQLARDLMPVAKEAVRMVDATKQDALKLARKSHEEQEVIAERILGGRDETIPDAIREVEREKVKARLEDIAVQAVKATDGVYDVIVVDPPWDMHKIELDALPEQVEYEYPTMTEAELSELRIPAADDCHLWLWTTQRFLPVAMRLLEKWEFKYVCTFVWHKNDGFQPFELPKYNCEFVLYAKKGTPLFVDTKAFFTCFEAPRGRHSEKPEAFYEVVRRVTAGRRLDMFSRRKIEGFDAWGNEVE
jgi:N6-adenosine-specific RNA methylase IME4/ParB-like chromosome segregation protein Spo0J